MVRKLPVSYFYLPDNLRSDKQIVLASFEQYVPDQPWEEDFEEERLFPSMDNTEEWWRTCDHNCVSTILWVPEPLRHDFEVARDAVTAVPSNYNSLPLEMRRIKEVTVQALESCKGRHGNSLVDTAFIPPEFLDDEEVISCAVKTLGMRAFLLASDRLQKQRSIVSVLFEHHGYGHVEIFGEVPAPARDLFSEKLTSDKKNIRLVIDKNNSWLRTHRKFSGKPTPNPFDVECEELRAAIARYFSDDIDVLRLYLQPLNVAHRGIYRCNILPYLSSNMRDNEEVVGMCIRGGIHGDMLSHASPRLLGDRKFVLNAISTISAIVLNPPILSALSPALRDDPEILRRLLLVNPDNYAFASSRLRAKDVVQLMLPSQLKIFELAPENPTDNHEFMVKVACHAEVCVQFASERLRDNKQFVMAVLEGNRKRVQQLQLFSPRLRGDFDVVCLAFEKTVPQLELVSEHLRDNKELVLMAVRKSIEQLQLVSERLREDTDLIISVLRHFRYPRAAIDPALIPKRVYSNKAKMKRLFRAAKCNNLRTLYEACSPRLRDDLDLALEVMHKLIHVKKNRMRNHPHPFMEACRVYMLSSPRLRASPELIAKFVDIHTLDPYFIPHFLPDNLRDSKAFMMELVRLIPCTFRAASERLRGDVDVLSRAMEKDAGASIYATGSQEEVDRKVATVLDNKSRPRKRRRRAVNAS